MIKIILIYLGIYVKYTIEYNSLFVGSKNKTIDFYYYKNCPYWVLKESVLDYLKYRIITSNGVVYIEKINNITIQEQFIL